MNDTLSEVAKNSSCALYEITGDDSLVRRYIASTPETRSICNDPFLVGVRYTSALRHACAETLFTLQAAKRFDLVERETTVLHILRGGLNFGIREALAEALHWNAHSSAFISAQRARSSENPEDWYITENVYNKIYLPKNAAIIFGDVVATGTSLHYALRSLLALIENRTINLSAVYFLTIGGVRAEEILAEIDSVCRKQFPAYQGASVIYFEGRFDVARPESKLSIKYTGTDLLRSNSLLAPEFVSSQYGSPAYPIERCTIYDAGSRAFWLEEYFHDVEDYWAKTLELAETGITYRDLLAERFPELDPAPFSEPNLVQICRSQLAKLP